MDGAASDLRTGLPWQMVEIHEPVRSLFLIETTPESMLRIMDRERGIGRLCRNGWVLLALIDPETRAAQRFPGRGIPTVSAAGLGAAQGGFVGRLVSRLARPPGIRGNRAVEPLAATPQTDEEYLTNEHRFIQFLG